MLTNPKSPVEKKLQSLQLHTAHITILEELRGNLRGAQVNQGSEHFEWYRPYFDSAIGAGIKALAALIDSEAHDVSELVAENQAAAL